MGTGKRKKYLDKPRSKREKKREKLAKKEERLPSKEESSSSNELTLKSGGLLSTRVAFSEKKISKLLQSAATCLHV